MKKPPPKKPRGRPRNEAASGSVLVRLDAVHRAALLKICGAAIARGEVISTAEAAREAILAHAAGV